MCLSLSWCLEYMYFAFLIPACGMLTQAGLPFPYVYGSYPPCLEGSANTNIPWFCPHIRFMCVLESVRLVHLVTEGHFSKKKKNWLCMDMLWISALLARHPLMALQGFEAWFYIYSHFHAARLVCVGWSTLLLFGQPCPFHSPFSLGLAHLDSIPFGYLHCLFAFP